MVKKGSKKMRLGKRPTKGRKMMKRRGLRQSAPRDEIDEIFDIIIRYRAMDYSRKLGKLGTLKKMLADYEEKIKISKDGLTENENIMENLTAIHNNYLTFVESKIDEFRRNNDSMAQIHTKFVMRINGQLDEIKELEEMIKILDKIINVKYKWANGLIRQDQQNKDIIFDLIDELEVTHIKIQAKYNLPDLKTNFSRDGVRIIEHPPDSSDTKQYSSGENWRKLLKSKIGFIRGDILDTEREQKTLLLKNEHLVKEVLEYTKRYFSDRKEINKLYYRTFNPQNPIFPSQWGELENKFGEIFVQVNNIIFEERDSILNEFIKGYTLVELSPKFVVWTDSLFGVLTRISEIFEINIQTIESNGILLNPILREIIINNVTQTMSHIDVNSINTFVQNDESLQNYLQAVSNHLQYLIKWGFAMNIALTGIDSIPYEFVKVYLMNYLSGLNLDDSSIYLIESINQNFAIILQFIQRIVEIRNQTINDADKLILIERLVNIFTYNNQNILQNLLVILDRELDVLSPPPLTEEIIAYRNMFLAKAGSVYTIQTEELNQIAQRLGDPRSNNWDQDYALFINKYWETVKQQRAESSDRTVGGTVTSNDNPQQGQVESTQRLSTREEKKSAAAGPSSKKKSVKRLQIPTGPIKFM